MVGTINTDVTSVHSTDDRYFGGSFEPTPNAPDDNQYVLVQLRPGLELVRKCLLTLKAIADTDANADVPYSLTGVTNDAHECLLTIAVDFGPRTAIAKPSEEAVAGFNFVSNIFSRMFEFLPQYTGTPDADAQSAATALVRSLTSATVAQSAATAV